MFENHFAGFGTPVSERRLRNEWGPTPAVRQSAWEFYLRYLGNKTQLLAEIEGCARRLGFERGTVCDLFAGSGVVSRYFRGLGNRVLANDLMYSSHLFQQVYLELETPPQFEQLDFDLPPPAVDKRLGSQRSDDSRRSQWQRTLSVVRYLEEVVPEREGLLTRQYSPHGSDQRQYFRERVARRLDAIFSEIREWHLSRRISENERALLTAATIDGADRLANISGTYGAYLKRWQANTDGQVELRIPQIAWGPQGGAHRRDAFEWLPEVEADLLYLDPPYNHRQYPANYHLFEVMARCVIEPDLQAFEQSIYGKTGLIPWKQQASRLCVQRGKQCFEAFRELVLSTQIPRIVISYNEEGIVDRREFEEMLAEYVGTPTRKLPQVLHEVAHPRFRSDADGRVAHSGGATRQYRQLPGRDKNVVHEWLWFAQKR